MGGLDEDRLFPADPATRDIARGLFAEVRDLAILSPHGHTDPRWYAENDPFPDPAQLFVVPDHYVFRMLLSQRIDLDRLGVPRTDGGPVETDPRQIFRLFAENYHLFRATPSAMWLEYSMSTLFGCDVPLSGQTADICFDRIEHCLGQPEFRPRSLYDRFGIEVIATTDSALDDLRWHDAIAAADWSGRVIPTYRPDAIVDPEADGFVQNLDRLAEITGCDTTSFEGYLAAHRARRAYFKARGATATDHGHPTARTEDLSAADAAALFQTVRGGDPTPQESDRFRGQMLTEMARMSLDDGLVMQIHPGSMRNHNRTVLLRHGRDKGFDIPGRTDYVKALQPLLNAVGLEPGLTIILFTLDESAYGRELAPLAGVYPALKLGPPWWFFDSFEGITRFRELTTETCGFYNTVGFNDDTRAFCSIPARHDVARRADCAYLAVLVATGRLRKTDASAVARDLAYQLAKEAYRL